MAVSQLRKSGRGASRQSREAPVFLDDLLTMAESLARSRKERVSSQLEGLADSLRQFSGSLPSMPTVKTYADTAADSLEDLASYVLSRDLPEMVTAARDLARRHPVAIFGGSVVAGVVIAQLVQSRVQPPRTAASARRSRRASRARGAADAGKSGDDEAS